MRRLEFQTRAPSEEPVRRWQRQSHPVHPFTTLLDGKFAWFLVSLASLYVYHSYLDYHSRFAGRTAFINGRTFTATNVIVLVDTSDSMEGTGPILDQHLENLRKSGIWVGDPFAVKGFGFSATGPADNALHRLQEALQSNPAADAIYLFSDFYPPNNIPNPFPPNADDLAGLGQLQRLLQEGPRRLYLGTVREMPGEQLIGIAKNSGGDLVESK